MILSFFWDVSGAFLLVLVLWPSDFEWNKPSPKKWNFCCFCKNVEGERKNFFFEAKNIFFQRFFLCVDFSQFLSNIWESSKKFLLKIGELDWRTWNMMLETKFQVGVAVLAKAYNTISVRITVSITLVKKCNCGKKIETEKLKSDHFLNFDWPDLTLPYRFWARHKKQLGQSAPIP